MESSFLKYFLKPDGLYFLSHSIGCLSTEQIAVKEAYFSSWQHMGGHAWHDWLPAIDLYRQALANFTKSNASQFCYQINTSIALIKIIQAIPKDTKRKKIIVSDLEFPSIQFIFKYLPKEHYELKLIKNVAGKVTASQWLNEIDENTLIVFVSLTTYGNSFKQPVAEIALKCQEKNVFSILDIAQAVGVLPIHLEDLNFNFAIGSCVKWLCGGTGAGFMWVQSDTLNKLTDFAAGWFGMENIFAEDFTDLKPAKQAKQFMDGTPCVLPMQLATCSINKLAEIGIENIFKHNQACLTELYQFISNNMNFDILSPANMEERGGTLVFTTKQDEKLLAYLSQHNVHVDSKPNFGIRLSPHIYTSWEEINSFKDILLNYVSKMN